MGTCLSMDRLQKFSSLLASAIRTEIGVSSDSADSSLCLVLIPLPMHWIHLWQSRILSLQRACHHASVADWARLAAAIVASIRILQSLPAHFRGSLRNDSS